MTEGKDALRRELARAAESLGAPAGLSPLLERPRDPAFGDWATNLAMVLAKQLGLKPRDLAQSLIAAIDMRAAGLASAEIAGPGFINFRLDTGTVSRGIAALVAAGSSYGRGAVGSKLVRREGVHNPISSAFQSALSATAEERSHDGAQRPSRHR